MAKTVTISYAGGTLGTDIVNLNLLSDVDNYTTPFETSIPKASFAIGYTSNLVPDAATIIRVQATGSVCTSFQNITISNPIPPAGTAYIGSGYDASTESGACNDAGVNNRTLYSELDNAAFSDNFGQGAVGSIVYVDPNLNTRLLGQAFVYMNQFTYNINATTGLITAKSTYQC